ncbi:zinc metalloprotease [Spirochaetia bacterium]|nr:zinc metalloprotease [Spirochaetia bacterium]
MVALKIVLGLIGLGVVVFVHELGHFLAACLVGIDVEAFSLGWGKPILKKKIGAVEYRLGMFPLGGYCKMRGDNEFQEAYDNRQKTIAPVPGTFYGASPWRRIVVSFAGPFFNFVFAALVLTVIWGIGFEVQTLENRIVLASDIEAGSYPADKAGLKTGDRIIEINGKTIENYHDIQENIAVNPEKMLPLRVERDGQILNLTIIPTLDKNTGAGKIGVYYWAEPVIEAVVPGSPAELAGLRPEDRLLSVNGEALPYTVALLRINQEKLPALSLEYERNGVRKQAELPVTYTKEGDAKMGIEYRVQRYHTPRLFPPAALVKGTGEAWKTLVISAKSLTLLFRGIDLTQAVSGPARITYMLGDIAAEGFGQSIGTGLSSMSNFLALISIALCIMNLLPLPILDGGLILLFIIEIIKRKPLHPKAINAFQTAGVVIIFSIMLFAVFGDILFFVNQ